MCGAFDRRQRRYLASLRREGLYHDRRHPHTQRIRYRRGHFDRAADAAADGYACGCVPTGKAVPDDLFYRRCGIAGLQHGVGHPARGWRFEKTAVFSDFFSGKIPVYPLLRKNTCVLKSHRLDIKLDIFILQA